MQPQGDSYHTFGETRNDDDSQSMHQLSEMVNMDEVQNSSVATLHNRSGGKRSGGIIDEENETITIDPLATQDIQKNKFKLRFIKFKNCILDNVLLLLTIVGVALGLIIGVPLNVANSKQPEDNNTLITPATLAFLKLPGDLLLRALNCCIVPLIVSSMISAITSISETVSETDRNMAHAVEVDTSQNPIQVSGMAPSTIMKKQHTLLIKMAALTLGFYLTTTLLAVITGLVMVNVIRPGQVLTPTNATHSDVMSDLQPLPLRGLIHDIHLQNVAVVTESNGTSPNNTSSVAYKQIIAIIESFVPNNLFDAASNENGGSVNVLGLIVFSVFMAIVMIQIGEPAKPVVKLFKSLNSIILKMVAWIICYAPIGIMFLIIWRCVKEKDLILVMSQLMIYMLTVFSGLAVHSIITLTVVS